MPIIPQSNVGQLQFCESHTLVWTNSAAQIGLTAAQATTFKNLTGAARAAYDAAQIAKQQYRAAITAQNAALSAAISGTGGAADLIRVIKSYANLQANPDNVYSAAQIPPPAPPAPAPAPGQPTNVTVTLEPTGAITLRWKAVNAAAGAGTFFSVERKLQGESMFSLVGTVGVKSFTDYGITLGTPGATYIITGQRGDRVGQPSEQIGVQFGVGGGGGFVVSNATIVPTVSAPGVKIAA